MSFIGQAVLPSVFDGLRNWRGEGECTTDTALRSPTTPRRKVHMRFMSSTASSLSASSAASGQPRTAPEPSVKPTNLMMNTSSHNLALPAAVYPTVPPPATKLFFLQLSLVCENAAQMSRRLSESGAAPKPEEMASIRESLTAANYFYGQLQTYGSASGAVSASSSPRPASPPMASSTSSSQLPVFHSSTTTSVSPHSSPNLGPHHSSGQLGSQEQWLAPHLHSSLTYSSTLSQGLASHSSGDLRLPGVVLHPPRVCVDCGRESSIQWRSGPMGSSTLCNACGMRYMRKRKKEEEKKRGDSASKERKEEQEEESNSDQKDEENGQPAGLTSEMKKPKPKRGNKDSSERPTRRKHKRRSASTTAVTFSGEKRQMTDNSSSAGSGDEHPSLSPTLIPSDSSNRGSLHFLLN